jgi:hypothetical protein
VCPYPNEAGNRYGASSRSDYINAVNQRLVGITIGCCVAHGAH